MARSSGRLRSSFFLIAAFAAALCHAMPAAAQRLDDQYKYYLDNYCNNLGFNRDNTGRPLATEAGPVLAQYCTGFPVLGPPGSGPQPPPPSGSGAAASGSAAGDAADALRRRREEEGDATTPDIDLATFGHVSLFMTLDYLHERQDSTPYEGGRSSRTLGGLLGVDYRFASGVLGVAANYGRVTGDLAGGGDFKGHDAGLVAFGSLWGRDAAFIDFAAGYNLGRLDMERVVGLTVTSYNLDGSIRDVRQWVPPASAYGKPRHRDVTAELRAGFDFQLGGLALGPRTALTLRNSRHEAYRETGATPMALAFAETRVKSMQSQLGLQAGIALPNAHFVLLPQFNADWMHELEADQQLLAATFAEDIRANPRVVRFLNTAPDRDWFSGRLSIAAAFIHGFSGFVAAEGIAGHEYLSRYRFSLGVRKEL